MTRHLVLAIACLSLTGCPDATEVATQCVAADLVGQCPVGSNPVLGASAEATCGGSFELKAVGDGTSVTGQCGNNGTCEFYCQYASPCSCGVQTLSKDLIICAECPDQSCGDGRCEGTERASCESGAAACFPCIEDCGGSTCGDGDCTGTETPDTCPQDCASVCTPSTKLCVGTILQVCSADGRSKTEFDCATAGLICGQGACVAPGACGNGACESNETPQSCPEDCGTVCVPSTAECRGNDVATCNANGTEVALVDCAASGLVCARGSCVAADICGNGRCEAGEDATCAADCAATCNNRICENGEDNSCPQDCTVCGDRLCGAGELIGCPQDCGICLPSERVCLGQLLRVCNANGTAFEDFDCRAFDQACVSGDCREPDVCGNGACELGETLESCATDCTTVCGDRLCEGAETFTTCSTDCEPQCGDASCQGDETFAGCPLDCLATCGNGKCDAAEDRDNCPRDCGYCGNGVCEDAAESASLFPANPLITCLADCVVSGCEGPADCNDGIFCTSAACVDGLCQYTAQDDLCPSDEKCIKFAGCCADKDRDGYADAACGGSDCNDDDALVHPGALEPCGGGDRNCSGTHRPALRPAKKVTNSPSYKTRLAMTHDGERFWATWLGVPETTQRLQYARVGKDGNLIGPIGELGGPAVADAQPAIAWNPVTGHVGLAYGVSTIGRFATLDANGVPTGDVFPDFVGTSDNHAPSLFRAVVADGRYAVSTWGGYNCGQSGNTRCDIGWYEVTEELTVTRPWGEPPSANDMVVVGTTVTGLASQRAPNQPGGTLIKVTPGVEGFTSADIVAPSGDGTCRIDHDGEAFVLVCQYTGWIGAQTDGGKVYYHRLASNGASLSTAVVDGVTTALPADIAVAPDGLVANDTAKIGVVLQESGSNLVFFLRDLDGREVVEPGVVAGGATIREPHVFWDGDAFQVFWLAKQGDIEQLFRTTVVCE
jgi:hypothetical protein